MDQPRSAQPHSFLDGMHCKVLEAWFEDSNDETKPDLVVTDDICSVSVRMKMVGELNLWAETRASISIPACSLSRAHGLVSAFANNTCAICSDTVTCK
jgi:hypothetical protein